MYRDRDDAGERLADILAPLPRDATAVLAIPNGGVPVGLHVARRLGLPLRVLVVRKLHIPWNPEAGFGAVAPDGTVVFHEALRRSLGLRPEEERAVVEEELAAIRMRQRTFRAEETPRLRDTATILVDDGLASGYSMLVAVRYARRLGARKVLVAVPTASSSAANLLRREADELVCPDVRAGPVFAVADAYRDWRDLSEAEVASLLHESRGRGP